MVRREADLSLVLDAPPPGTFNYSDTREYTPSEAIDLLNGVLQTKGYTLIRRGRMLLVINLKGGLPEGVVPQITLDDVDKRGKFELVTVRFPTGGRLMSTVVTEITPLLGPYGKVVPLPASAQVQVTDSAGILQSVKAQIQSIAEATTTPTGASEVLAHYPVRPADPQAALTTFKVLFPLVKMAYDETGDKLHVVATPAEQIMVQKLIEDMRTGNPAEKQARLESVHRRRRACSPGPHRVEDHSAKGDSYARSEDEQDCRLGAGRRPRNHQANDRQNG